MNSTIVKVQQTQVSSDGINWQFIYDRKRKFEEEQPLTQTVKKLLGTRGKAYFNALRKDGKWVLGKELPTQNW